MLALRADGKSEKTLDSYSEAADQFIGFLTEPPPLPEEAAELLDAARPVTGQRDITPTHRERSWVICRRGTDRPR